MTDTIDLVFLTKLQQIPLAEDKKVVKYVLQEGAGEIPSNSRIYINLKQYSFRGELLKTVKGLQFKETDNCQGLKIAINSMKRDEKAWFRVHESYLKEKSGRVSHIVSQRDGCHFEISIEEVKLKVEKALDVKERLSFYNETKSKGDEYFKKQSYVEAAKYYMGGYNATTGLPRKMVATPEEQAVLRNGEVVCSRNYLVSVVKGEVASEYEKAREISNKLVKKDRSAKHLYLQGKLLILMKYLTDGREILEESYKLQPDPNTLQLINKIRPAADKQKIVCKHIVQNLEKERIEQSKRKKREDKEEWFYKGQRQSEKKELLKKMVEGEAFDSSELWLMDETTE